MSDLIEQLKIKIAQTADETEEAGLLLKLLKESARVKSPDMQGYIDRLIKLGEKLNSASFKVWGIYYLAHFKCSHRAFTESLSLSEEAIAGFRELNELEGIANAFNNIGNIYTLQENYHEALRNYFQALKQNEEINDQRGIAVAFNNIGRIYDHQGIYPEALKNYLHAFQIFEKIGDKVGIANGYNNIGLIHSHQKNFEVALKNQQLAIPIWEEIDYKRGIARACGNIGNIYFKQTKYKEALANHLKALQISESLGMKDGIAYAYNNIGLIYYRENDYPLALENQLRALEIGKAIHNKKSMIFAYNAIGEIYEKQGKHESAIANELLALQLSEEIGYKEMIKESALSLFDSYKAMGDFESALKYHEKFYRVQSNLLGEQAQNQLTKLNFIHNLEQKDKDLEIEQLRNVDLKSERDKSEALLLNILPAEVAAELKARGKPEARLYDDVTVLYTDFIDFTRYTDKVSPQALVAELDSCFNAFDEITSKHHIEKIKTVGDAYIAISGLPIPNKNHAGDVARAAIEIREFMLNRRRQNGSNTFEIRIGIHSGSVVAGIVGIKKFAYDIWGDTVNTAARMEQNSEAGKINISQTTYELVKDKFNCVYRGEIEAKNKGKLRMYFIN